MVLDQLLDMYTHTHKVNLTSYLLQHIKKNQFKMDHIPTYKIKTIKLL